MAHQLAPFLEIFRRSKIHRVVLDRLPCDDEQIAVRVLDRAFEPHAVAALARRNSGTAFATPASNSLSRPGLMLICAISEIMSVLAIRNSVLKFSV
jgi:hypothetical protein